jgi:hypothetical protein
MLISATERNAEHEARKQRQGFAQLLRADESKAPTSADVMRIRRTLAAAAEGGSGYDAMLSEPTTNNLFACGALFFATHQTVGGRAAPHGM